jgi:uncharacterized membrane protein YkvA (DUF1232 family)
MNFPQFFRKIIDQVLLTWRLVRDPRVPLWSKLIPAAALIYILSPIDIIPDFLIVIGQLDDLGLLLASMRLFEAVVPEYIVAEHRAAISSRQHPLETVEAPTWRVIGEDDPER